MSIVVVTMSCDFERMRREREASRLAVDSLRKELITHQNMANTLLEVGIMLDSIDASRNALRTSMVEGTSHTAYTERLQEINRHVKNTQRKVESLEKALKQSRNSANASYKAALNKLRGELDLRNEELKALQERVAAYKLENEQLTSTVSNQQTELNERLNQLMAKQEEAASLDYLVKQLLVQSKIDQGEAYFHRAVAVEETANRTRFAPKKKRQTRAEALELYRLALVCGKTDAQARIDALQKKL